MINEQKLIFPALVYLVDYESNFAIYMDAVYKIFRSHFIDNPPLFNGNKVTAQKFPLVDGKYHRTFYHITHEGDDEQNRRPDFRRMERIRFPKFIIDGCPHTEFLVWKNVRQRDTRVLIFNQEEKYLVVLTERKGYYLFWTAYCVDQIHTYRKLMYEYETYIKTKTAQ